MIKWLNLPDKYPKCEQKGVKSDFPNMNEKTLSNITALGEGFTTEFKRSMSSNLGREICAFANATGGVILIGVTDGGEVVGVAHHNKLKSQIQSIARSADPPIAVEMDSVNGVLCITIPEQHGKPYSFRGKYYIREGASSQQMSRDEIREFFFKEGLIRFDKTPCHNFKIDKDLTPEAWARFAKRAHIPDGMDPIVALENLHLLENGIMTHAGAWLLAEDITRYTLTAGVTCAVLRGTTNTHIIDLKNFTGDICAIYDDCIAYMQAKLNTALIPHAHGRDERLELPEDALREAMVNAIAHRDYRSTAKVQVHIFHDRLEIVTPGGLPAGMREEDLGIRSVPRNPLLFGMFHRMEMVEQIGSGIRRIRQECRDYGVEEPVIEVSDNWVVTTFPRPSAQVEEQVTAQVKTNKSFNEKPNDNNDLQIITEKLKDLTAQVTAQVIAQVVLYCREPRATKEIMGTLGLKHWKTFRSNYLQPLLDDGWLEMTVPDKPTSSKQKYRLTAKGRKLLTELAN